MSHFSESANPSTTPVPALWYASLTAALPCLTGDIPGLSQYIRQLSITGTNCPQTKVYTTLKAPNPAL